MPECIIQQGQGFDAGVKTPPGVPTSGTPVLGFQSQFCFRVQLLANNPIGIVDGSSSWAPAIHMADVNRILGSQLWPGSVPAVADIWGVN